MRIITLSVNRKRLIAKALSASSQASRFISHTIKTYGSLTTRDVVCVDFLSLQGQLLFFIFLVVREGCQNPVGVAVGLREGSARNTALI